MTISEWVKQDISQMTGPGNGLRHASQHAFYMGVILEALIIDGLGDLELPRSKEDCDAICNEIIETYGIYRNTYAMSHEEAKKEYKLPHSTLRNNLNKFIRAKLSVAEPVAQVKCYLFEQEQACTQALDALLTKMKTDTFPVKRFLFFRGGENRTLAGVSVRLPKHLALMHDVIVKERAAKPPKSDKEIFEAIQTIVVRALAQPSKGRASATTAIYQLIQNGPEVIVAQNPAPFVTTAVPNSRR